MLQRRGTQEGEAGKANEEQQVGNGKEGTRKEVRERKEEAVLAGRTGMGDRARYKRRAPGSPPRVTPWYRAEQLESTCLDQWGKRKMATRRLCSQDSPVRIQAPGIISNQANPNAQT